MTSLITGLIVAIFTFPGIILRLIVSRLLCRYLDIPFFKVTYFEPNRPIGTSVFEPPRSPWTAIVLIFGPALANTLLGFLIGAPAVFAFFTYDETPLLSLLDIFLVWLGVSLAVHSFPTFEHAKAIENTLQDSRNPGWVQWMGQFLSVFAYAGAVGSMFWLDVIYALVLVVGIPIILLEVLRASF